jgi:hypothetical protein
MCVFSLRRYHCILIQNLAIFTIAARPLSGLRTYSVNFHLSFEHVNLSRKETLNKETTVAYTYIVFKMLNM